MNRTWASLSTVTHRSSRLAVLDAVGDRVPGRRLGHRCCGQGHADYHLNVGYRQYFEEGNKFVNFLKRGNNVLKRGNNLSRNQPHPIAGAEPEPRTGNKKGGDPDKRETQLPGPWTINNGFHLVLVIWKTHFKFS